MATKFVVKKVRKVVFEFSCRVWSGSVAEWSKALVLGTSHFGGVGSNPTTIKRVLHTVITKKRVKNVFLSENMTRSNISVLLSQDGRVV